jgi:hypothetical protein
MDGRVVFVVARVENQVAQMFLSALIGCQIGSWAVKNPTNESAAGRDSMRVGVLAILRFVLGVLGVLRVYYYRYDYGRRTPESLRSTNSE